MFASSSWYSPYRSSAMEDWRRFTDGGFPGPGEGGGVMSSIPSIEACLRMGDWVVKWY